MEWINSKDKLPENYTEVLCWIDNKEYIKVLIYIGCQFEDEDRVGQLVTFWQYLPESPKL